MQFCFTEDISRQEARSRVVPAMRRFIHHRTRNRASGPVARSCSLVADGLSNQEIAEKLVIAPGTGHLNHIYGELAVHNRTQAVAQARALRLL